MLFVNQGAGYEAAIDELNRDIRGYGGESKIIPISSRDYDTSSIDGILIDNIDYRIMLEEII
ncbi:MAG: hypothetical protein PF505_10820 [Vallitaleaceae bacterium]|jgi:hypothetical protein|nr:hypothetical protein [Vallitaleaceae bacterium]